MQVEKNSISIKYVLISIEILTVTWNIQSTKKKKYKEKLSYWTLQLAKKFFAFDEYPLTYFLLAQWPNFQTRILNDFLLVALIRLSSVRFCKRCICIGWFFELAKTLNTSYKKRLLPRGDIFKISSSENLSSHQSNDKFDLVCSWIIWEPGAETKGPLGLFIERRNYYYLLT